MLSNLIEIGILSLIQGISEFLPISSSAHLIVISTLYDFKSSSLLMDVSLHLGSLFAIIFYFKKDILNFQNNKKLLTLILIGSIGNHNGITMAGSHGHFELNVFKPLIAHNVLQSIDLLSDSSKNFALFCVKGIIANKKKIKEYLDNSLMLVTALAPWIGYDNAAKIAKLALKNNTTLKYEAVKSGLVSEKKYNKIVNPKKMISPS